MCYVVIAGGPNKDLEPILPTLSEAESVICADSGADALRPYDIIPDVVYGDMDSISGETLKWLEDHQVSRRLFPVEKDMTDSELCLTGIPKAKIKNFYRASLMVMRLKEEGYDISATDGRTWVYPLCGECSWRVPDRLLNSENTCSLIPLGKGVYSVSTVGMKYPLSDRDILPGSSLTVSNEFDMTKEEHGFDMKAGTMLVIVTRKE